MSLFLPLTVTTFFIFSLAQRQEFFGQPIGSNETRIIGKTAVNDYEVVYLCDCRNGVGGGSSEMAYYSDFRNSRNGQAPMAIAVTTSSHLATWDDHTVSGRFSDGTIFSVWDLNSNVAKGGSTGQARVDLSSFQCWSEGSEEQYASNGRACNRIYSCAHQPPWESSKVTAPLAQSSLAPAKFNPMALITDKAKLAASQRMLQLSSPVGHLQVQLASHMFDLSNSWEVYHNIWNSRNNIGCSDQTFDVGDGCFINFDCTWPDDGWATANAIATFLDTNVGSHIMPKIVRPSPQHQCNWGCESGAEPPFRPPPPCCMVPQPSYTVYQFPQEVKIDIYSQDGYSRGHLYASISCPPPPGCNSKVCDAIAAGIPLLPVPGSDVLGPLTAIGCDLFCG